MAVTPVPVLSPDPGRRLITHELAIEDDAARLKASHLEWLLTNGAGSFAMGTVAGVNTRRYHGLLIAAEQPPVGRIVALNQVIDRLTLHRGGASQAIEFMGMLFHEPNGVGRPLLHGQGPTLLRCFSKGLSVCWVYGWGDIEFQRELFVHWKQPAATLRFTVRGLGEAADAASLSIRPLVTLRDFHDLLHRGGQDPFSCDIGVDDVVVRRGRHAVTLHGPGGRLVRGRDWWYHFHYPVDAQRGQGCVEDHFTPGTFEYDLPIDDECSVELTVTLGTSPAAPAPDPAQSRREHLGPIFEHLMKDESSVIPLPQQRMLAIAADDFVVDRTIGGRKLSTILAGYPWFADWGRDTFIALPGLLLCTGRFREARDTLAAFAAAIRNGLVPNRFDDYDESAAHHNTVDASLWYIKAALEYLDASDDRDSWKDWLRAAVLEIMEAYIRGTDYGIRMAGDGLITAGGPDTQLTWMDAACGGVVFTPRHGKAVEINALWYHALVSVARRLKSDDKRAADHFNKLAKRVSRAFPKVFWNDAADCCYDHVWTDEAGVDHPDASIRPNQVFVAAIPDSPLPRTKLQGILRTVEQRLLTPVGLRTLPADDPNYHPDYAGDQFHRDEAYHQGTVWPWLIGPYAEAVLRVGRFSESARHKALHTITPLLERLAGDGLGQLHEIHEAGPPHSPAGCIAQAWSVSELLRVLKLIDHGR